MAEELKRFDAKVKALRLRLIAEVTAKKALHKNMQSMYATGISMHTWESERYVYLLGREIKTIAERLTLLNKFMQYTYGKIEEIPSLHSHLHGWFVKDVHPFIVACLADLEAAKLAGEERAPNARIDRLKSVEVFLVEKDLLNKKDIEVDIVNAFIAVDRGIRTRSVPSSRKRYAEATLAFVREVFEREYKRVEEECMK